MNRKQAGQELHHVPLAIGNKSESKVFCFTEKINFIIKISEKRVKIPGYTEVQERA